MGLLALVALALAGAAATLSSGRWPLARAALGALALGGCAILAYALDPRLQVTFGDGALLASRFLRLWLLTGALALLLLQLLILAVGRVDGLAPAALVLLAVGAIALALPDATAALLAATAGAVVLDLAAARPAEGPAAPGAAVDALRVTVLAAVLGLAAIAWASVPALGLQPTTILAAYLLVAGAICLRIGALPLHLPAARLAEAVPRPVLPLLVGWLPAVFALVALGWFAATLVPLAPDLGWVRPVVVAVGLLTLAATSLGMLMQEDLGHVLGYLAIQGGSLALLALASLEPSTGVQIRVWLLVLPLTLAAFAAAVYVIEHAFGTRRVAELAGWLRRAPITGGTLLLAVVGTYGLPGLLQFEARREVFVAAAGPTLGALGLLGAGLAILAWVRLAWVGLRPIGPAVAGGTSERPTGPATLAPATLARNRIPLAALLALLVSLLPVGLGLGLGHLGAVAAAPIPVARPSTKPVPTPAPTASPGPSPGGLPQPSGASTQRSTSRS